MNPLFEQYGRNQNGNQNNIGSRFIEFVNNFRRNSTKSPEETVKDLIASGKMSQQQFEQFKQMANKLTGKNY